VTGVLVDGVRLALVLVHRGVDEVHDVRADRREEHGGELHLRDGGRPRVSVSPLAAQTQFGISEAEMARLFGGVVAGGGLDGNNRTGSHFTV
jgi:hypothetical protein